MIYAISDIHGMYDKYLKMLEVINFNDNDTVFSRLWKQNWTNS